MIIKIFVKIITVVLPFISGIVNIINDENGKRLIKTRNRRRGVK